MSLKLERPIVIFDLETTGTSVTTDRIVEISLVKITPGCDKPEVHSRRINPERPIPPEATAVHHITDADVASCPTFKQISLSLKELIDGCDFAGFNSNRFDLPLLAMEFLRAGVKFDFRKSRFIDVQTIFHKKEPRTLVAAYRYYCGKNLDDAHSAEGDALATYEVLLAQLERYPDLPRDIDGLSNYTTQNRNVDLMGRLIYDESGREVINFGRYKGRLAEEICRQEPGFVNWVLQGDFSPDTKDCFIRIQERVRSKKKD